MATIKQIKDTSGNIHDIIDSKVTSVDNHYTPSANTGSELTASLSGTAGSYKIDTEYTVLTGVKAQRDAKGHVTGLTYTAQKIKDTNTAFTHPAGVHVNDGNQTWYGNKSFNGSISLKGNDLYLKTPSDTSNDSSDIVFTYGNGSEKSRIYMVNDPTSGIGPNYRVKNTSGTILYDGRLATLADITDTKNTAGASDLSNSDGALIYVVGAISQADSSITCTNQYVYIDTVNNSLHAKKMYQDSDERLKTFTEDYDINLNDIKNIKTGKFYWNDDERREINGGVSAQSVEKYFPELVSENEDGIKSVNYDGLAVVALAAIKKLTDRIEQLEEIIRNK